MAKVVDPASLNSEPVNNFGRYRQPSTERRRRGDPAPEGRYDGRSARPPAAGLARTAIRRDTTVAAVADPWGRGERILATIDRRVDILELERSHKRITEAAYQTGRQVQAVLERQGKIKSADLAGASRGDPAQTRLTNTIRLVCSAKEILALEERIRGRIGIYDMRLLRRVIGDRMSFAECAAQEGKGGDRGTWYMANRFRDALEDLAEVFASVGKSRPAPQDAYREAAVGLGEREAAAIAGGVTRARYADEAAEKREAAAATRSARDRARLTAEAEDLEGRLARMEAARTEPGA